jgi:hypothetical protein
MRAGINRTGVKKECGGISSRGGRGWKLNGNAEDTAAVRAMRSFA